MKPLNADNPGCTTISSDCVIWQGPDIECINLCKSDTVSNVVNKLALEICEILDILDIDSYDLSCFNLGDCSPENFQALIQLLITKICALEDVTPVDSEDPRSGIPSGVPINTRILAGNGYNDTIIEFPEIFHYDNSQGDRVTQGQIIDLVNAAANRLNSLVGEIATINNTLNNHEFRIEALENETEAPLVLPNVVPVCVLPPDLVALDVMTQALEQEFCTLRTSTGTSQNIYDALINQCAGLNDSPQLQKSSATMSDIPQWNDTVTNLAQGFTNVLLTICDIRASIQSIQEFCCTTTSCDDLNIEVQGIVINPNTLQLYFTGTFPSGFQETVPSGSIVSITDELSNSINATIAITPILNDVGGFSVDLSGTPINTSTNLTISVPLSFTDGVSQCDKVITEVVVNTSACPTVVLTPAETTIDYTMTYLGGAGSIDVKLYDSTGTILIASQTTVVAGPQAVLGQFITLNPGVQYKVQVEITITGAANPTVCPFGSTTTTGPLCLPPTGTTVVLNIP